MSLSSTNPVGWGPLGPDPGRGIRILIALMLRFAIGLTMLNTGLAGYLNVRSLASGMTSSIANVSYTGLDPFFAAIPYLAIALGLALILGFLITPTSVAAGFFGLLTPLMTTVAIVSIGMTSGGGSPGGFFPGRMGNDPFQYTTMMLGMASYLPSLIPLIVLIWLSPVENHPYSLDALIFRRGEVQFVTPAPAPAPAPTPVPSNDPELTIG